MSNSPPINNVTGVPSAGGPPQGLRRRQMRLAWQNSMNFRSSLAVPNSGSTASSTVTSPSNPPRLLSKAGRRSNKGFSRAMTFSASSTHNRQENFSFYIFRENVESQEALLSTLMNYLCGILEILMDFCFGFFGWLVFSSLRNRGINRCSPSNFRLYPQ